MAEGEVNYASVVFKANKSPTAEAKKAEETVYDEVKVKNELTEQTDDTKAKKAEETVYDEVKVKNEPTEQSDDTKADKAANNRDGHFQLLACCLGILCVVLLLAIIGVCVYITTFNDTSEENQLKENLMILQAINFNLTNINNKLNSTVNSLTVQLDNLNKSYAALESNNTDVIAENQELKAQNQQLETQMKNLTDMLQDMETERNEVNVSRAQWSIDQYCPIDGTVRKCKSCQAGWLQDESSCYAINDARPPNQTTWDGAQTDCKGKNSELAVINNAQEKEYISKNSWYPEGINGYWIGLRVVDGKWTWVDGSDLTDISWIQPASPTEGHCAISVPNNGLKSVNCSDRNAWICEKKALSLTPPSKT